MASHKVIAGTGFLSQPFYTLQDKLKRDITTNLTSYLLLRHKGDLLSLRTLSNQLTAKVRFFPDIMTWLDENMPKTDLKYLLINLHGQFNLDSRFMYSTSIFPVPNSDGTFLNPRPIFFNPSSL